jgi:hypothetical protein
MPCTPALFINPTKLLAVRKRDRLALSAHQSVETGIDRAGRYWIAYKGDSSMFTRHEYELQRFFKGIRDAATRAALDSWLVSLVAMDRETL